MPCRAGALSCSTFALVCVKPSCHRLALTRSCFAGSGIVIPELDSGDAFSDQAKLAALVQALGPQLPATVRSGVARLLADTPADRPTAADLLRDRVPRPILPFPASFSLAYTILAQCRAAAPARRPEVIRRHLPELLLLGEEALALVLPAVLALFTQPASHTVALDLIDTMAGRLGPVRARRQLLPLIVTLFGKV